MYQEIAVDMNTLSNDLEVLQTEIASVRQNINRMYEAVSMLNSMWEGPAKNEFMTQFARDKADMLQLCDMLQNMADSMTNARGQYNECEKEVGRIVAAIKI